MVTSSLLGDCRCVVDLHIEVAQALVVVAQAAVALVEQILVDAAFLEDRNQALDPLWIDAGALDQQP